MANATTIPAQSASGLVQKPAPVACTTDELDAAVGFCLTKGRVSAELLKRELSFTLPKSDAAIARMVDLKIVGPGKDSQSLQPLITAQDWEKMKPTIVASTTAVTTAAALPISIACGSVTVAPTDLVKAEGAKQYEFHTYSHLLPMMTEEETQRLREDIRANGLLEEVTLHEDKILDGRNRYAICVELGIPCRFTRFDELKTGMAPLAWVISKNVNRRQLTDGQRAAVAARYKEVLADEAKRRQGSRTDIRANLRECCGSKAAEDAAKLTNTKVRSVENTAQVLKKGVPELFQSIEKGKVAPSAAAAVTSLPPEEQRELVAKGPGAIRAAAKVQRAAKANAKKRVPSASTSQPHEPEEDQHSESVPPAVPRTTPVNISSVDAVATTSTWPMINADHLSLVMGQKVETEPEVVIVLCLTKEKCGKAIEKVRKLAKANVFSVLASAQNAPAATRIKAVTSPK